MRRGPRLLARCALIGLLCTTGIRHAGAQAPQAIAPEPDPQPEPVVLERPEPSQGRYLAVGIAAAMTMAWDDGRGYRAPAGGYALNLRLGESVTSWLDLGLVFSYASTRGDPGRALTYGGLRVQAQLYPLQRLFVRTGFGFLLARGTDPNDDRFVRRTTGAVVELGVGLNVFLSDASESGGWVLTPVLSFEIGPDRSFTTLATSVGIEISLWSGLRRDQLDLPVERAYDDSDD